MYSVDKAVALIAKWPASRQKERAEAARLVEALAAQCREAVRLWEEYLKNPGAPGDRFSLLSWIGADRAKRLYDINLTAAAIRNRLTALAGPAAGRLSALDQDVIETGYQQLKDNETGPHAAEASVARLNDRIRYLSGLKPRLGPTGKVAAGKPATKKKPPAKKPAPKKKPKKAAVVRKPKKSAKKKK